MASNASQSIVFFDIRDREEAAEKQLQNDIQRLQARQNKNGGGLSAVDQDELNRLMDIDAVTGDKYIDPLFATTKAAWAEKEKGGVQPIDIRHNGKGIIAVDANSSDASRESKIMRVALVLGLLQYRNVPLPRLVAEDDEVIPDPKDKNTALFIEAFYAVVGRAAGNVELAKRVLRNITSAVDTAGDKLGPAVSTLDFARVFEKMIEGGRRREGSEPQAARR
jgi:hypothetical protein